MNKREYSRGRSLTKDNRGRGLKRIACASVVAVLAMVVGVGSASAFLIDVTPSVVNTFAPSNVTTSVDENFDGEVKNDVKIKNTGDTAAYIRAEVVVSWVGVETVDGEEVVREVYGVAPSSDDYAITWSGLDSGTWFEADGFYYYGESVAAGEATSVLFTDCKLKDGAKVPDAYEFKDKDGKRHIYTYRLSVEVVGSGIQAIPAEAVESAWTSVKVDGNGQLAAKTS